MMTMLLSTVIIGVVIGIIKRTSGEFFWPLLLPVIVGILTQILIPVSIWAGVCYAASIAGVIVCRWVQVAWRRRRRKLDHLNKVGTMP